MTSLECAKKLIRAYVIRGDSIESLMRSHMGAGSKDESASIGGYINHRPDEPWDPKHIEKVPTSKILVEKVGGKYVNEVFSLAELYNDILKEKKQPTLFK